ncbi:hypothetical protein [Lonepinella sp. BR2357]|uniref:hypothetical protein n=1 Tax=Lonepinella sp. BR2357 TaxID=3434549 RepID=UPI003F6DE2B5
MKKAQAEEKAKRELQQIYDNAIGQIAYHSQEECDFLEEQNGEEFFKCLIYHAFDVNEEKEQNKKKNCVVSTKQKINGVYFNFMTHTDTKNTLITKCFFANLK